MKLLEQVRLLLVVKVTQPDSSHSTKGRTIRKVMGGRGIFELQEFFFVIKFLV